MRDAQRRVVASLTVAGFSVLYFMAWRWYKSTSNLSRGGITISKPHSARHSCGQTLGWHMFPLLLPAVDKRQLLHTWNVELTLWGQSLCVNSLLVSFLVESCCQDIWRIYFHVTLTHGFIFPLISDTLSYHSSISPPRVECGCVGQCQLRSICCCSQQPKGSESTELQPPAVALSE